MASSWFLRLLVLALGALTAPVRGGNGLAPRRLRRDGMGSAVPGRLAIPAPGPLTARATAHDGTGFTFATAANKGKDTTGNDHSCVLLLLLKSLNVTYPSATVIVYDIGVDRRSPLDEGVLRAAFTGRLELRVFDYDRYPAYVRVDQPSAGQYAWKPIIIKGVVDEFGSVLWMDSGNSVGWTKFGLEPNNVTDVFRRINEVGFYSPGSKGTMRDWTHPGMLAEMMIDPSASFLDEAPCNGAYIGFAKNAPAYKTVLVPWYECALKKSCIGPQGSNRSNHRQDQSALSLLAYKQGLGCFPLCVHNCGGVRIHNDGLRRAKMFCTAFQKRYAAGILGTR